MPTIATAALKASALYAAFFMVMGFVLVILVVRQRRMKSVGIGDGGDKHLARAIRVHGNFIEHMPAAFAALILLPLLGASATLVHAVGAMLVAGRLAHAWGLGSSAGPSAGRVGGMLLTNGALIFAAITLITLAL